MPSCKINVSILILAVIILSAAFISLEFYKQCPDVVDKNKDKNKMFLKSMLGMGILITLGMIGVIYF